MSALNSNHVADLRGAMRIGFDATAGLVSVVEGVHGTIQRLPALLGPVASSAALGVAGLVYRGVREGVSWIGQGIDWPLAVLQSQLPAGDESPTREAVLAALNGIYGDYLSRTRNPLAIEMSLRHGGKNVEASDLQSLLRLSEDGSPSPKLLLLVHGLCMNDLKWYRDGHDHGASLAEELGYFPLYLRYNSGLAIAENGLQFAGLLETLTANWTVPLQEITFIGHSMGGLVARSACFFAERADYGWRKLLRRIVFLGTPHCGVPLERGGYWLDAILDLSPYSAPFTQLGKARSAGIQALRHGAITNESDLFVPLPGDVECYAVAASLAKRRSLLSDRLLGDGLVPLDSALGRHKDAARSLGIPATQQWIVYEVGHLELLSSFEVYAQLRKWLQDSA
jgi:pimeloyl-ACP methyl ester carboxylesterase